MTPPPQSQDPTTPPPASVVTGRDTGRTRPGIELVCLDMAGTTVADDGAVLAAFHAALDDLEVTDAGRRTEMERYVLATMGESKIRVFRALFGDEARATQANRAFERAYDRQIDDGRVGPIPGAADVVTALRAAGLRVALLTGFAAATRDRLVAHLGWEELADVTLCPSEAGRGRPYPDLVLAAVLRTGAGDVAAVAVAGDTASDMESGRRAGAAIRAGVLTGTHGPDELVRAGATDVLASVRDLPTLLGIGPGVWETEAMADPHAAPDPARHP